MRTGIIGVRNGLIQGEWKIKWKLQGLLGLYSTVAIHLWVLLTFMDSTIHTASETQLQQAVKAWANPTAGSFGGLGVPGRIAHQAT